MLSLSQSRKSVVRLTDRLNLTIAGDWDVKPQTKQNKKAVLMRCIALCHPFIVQLNLC